MHTFPELFDEFERRVLPRQLTDADILKLRHRAFALDVNAGERADLPQGQDHFVYVAGGSAKLVAYVSSSREQIISFGFCREIMHVPSGGQPAFSLVALEAAELLAIPAESLLPAPGTDCALLRLAIEQTLVALNRSRNSSIILGTRSARERLAGFLLDMFERVPRGEREPECIRLPMSRTDIADSLGLTVETVSRQMSEMRQQRLVETVGRSCVRILDWEGVARAAGQTPLAA